METIKEKIRRIKYSRLHDEEKWFLDFIDGMKPIYSKERRNSIYFIKNKDILFEGNFEIGILRINGKIIKGDINFMNYKRYIIDMFYKYVPIEEKYRIGVYNKLQSLSIIMDESIFGIKIT